MLRLFLSLVAVIGIVALGWLFLEISKPGKRTVPVLIMVVALAAAAVLWREFPPTAMLVALLGVGAGFITAAVSKGSPDQDTDRRARKQ